jgi:hypothetical protein
MMQKSKFFSLFLVCNLLFTANANLQAHPPIVGMLRSIIENKNSIYAISFLIAGIYLKLGGLLKEKREKLSENFIPTYHEQTAYLTSQTHAFNATQPTFGPRLVCSINWPEFYDSACPTREIAKKLKALYETETICVGVGVMGLLAAFYTWAFTICFEAEDFK